MNRDKIEGLKKRVESAIDRVRTLTTKYPSRITGEKNTEKCAGELFEEIKSFTDKNFLEEFSVHPDAFLGWLKVTVIMYLIALIAVWLQVYWIAFLASAIYMSLFIFEFVLYYEFADPLYPEVRGFNVIGYIEPRDKVKQQIIVSGHHDSAHIFNFFVNKPELYPLRVYSAMAGTILMFLYSSFATVYSFFAPIPPGVESFFRWFLLLLFPVVGQFWFYLSPRGSPGAGDNMAAVSAAYEIGRYFRERKDRGDPLKHTRIIIAAFDCEEEGLRGSKAFIRRHYEELHSIPTYVFNMEVLYSRDELIFTTDDINGTVKLSERLADEGMALAKELGYRVEKSPFGFLNGGTDAGMFARYGIEATNFQGMKIAVHSHSPAYHTPRDTWEAVDPGAVEAAIALGIRLIEEKDREVVG